MDAKDIRKNLEQFIKDNNPILNNEQNSRLGDALGVLIILEGDE